MKSVHKICKKIGFYHVSDLGDMPIGGQGFGESLRGFSAPCGLGFGTTNSVKGLTRVRDNKRPHGQNTPRVILGHFFYAKRARTLDPALCIGYNGIIGMSVSIFCFGIGRLVTLQPIQRAKLTRVLATGNGSQRRPEAASPYRYPIGV